ncbi:PAAR domain-containing protein, partial [Vibrio anguillarum]
MSAQAEGRGLIHKGDKTTTGGVVTSGVGNVMFLGEGVTQIKMIATCPACKKGQGEIIPLEAIAVIVENMQVALHGDIVACDCPFGSNTLIASAGAMKFSQS